MRISIVTVSFNSAKTIVDTLQSVRSQTYSDLEHIVIDGASDDGTQDLIRMYGQHLSHFASEPDRGIYDAMNKGLAAAQGELIGFLNADDMFADADVVTSIADAAMSADQPDVVYGDLLYVAAANPARVVRRWRSGHFASQRLRYGWMPPHPTFYARTARLREAGGFDCRFRIAADYDCMLRILKTPGIRTTYIEQVLVRMRSGGVSNRSLSALWRKSSEDLLAMRRNNVGGLLTLGCKNLRKIPQWW